MMKILYDEEDILILHNSEDELFFSCRDIIMDRYAAKFQEYNCNIRLKLLWSNSRDFASKILYERPALSKYYCCYFICEINREGENVIFFETPYDEYEMVVESTPISWSEDGQNIHIMEDNDLQEIIIYGEEDGICGQLEYYLTMLSRQDNTDLKVQYNPTNNNVVSVKISLPTEMLQKAGFNNAHLEVFKSLICDQWYNLLATKELSNFQKIKKVINIEYDNEYFTILYTSSLEYFKKTTSAFIKAINFYLFRILAQGKKRFIKIKDDITENRQYQQTQGLLIDRSFLKNLKGVSYQDLEWLSTDWFVVNNMQIVVDGGDDQSLVGYLRYKLIQLVYLNYSS